MRLRSGGLIGRSDHLLPSTLLVLVSPIMASLGHGRIVSAVITAEVANGLGFPAEVGMDGLFTDGILCGDV